MAARVSLRAFHSTEGGRCDAVERNATAQAWRWSSLGQRAQGGGAPTLAEGPVRRRGGWGSAPPGRPPTGLGRRVSASNSKAGPPLSPPPTPPPPPRLP